MKISNTFTTALLLASSNAAGMQDAVLEGISLWNCSTCTLAFTGIDKVLQDESFLNSIESFSTKVCEFAHLAHTPSIVCPGMVKSYGDVIFDAASRYLLSKDRICNELLGLCKNPVIKELDLETVVGNILSTKPDFLKSDDFINKLYAEIAADAKQREVIRTVHMSDAHMDKDYLVGALVECGSYLCCRAEFGMPGPGQTAAREWGERTCDTVPKTVENML